MLFFLCKNWFSFIPCQTLHYCCLRSSLVCFNKICSLYFLSSTVINRRMFQRANIISKYGGEMCIWEQLKSNSHLFFLNCWKPSSSPTWLPCDNSLLLLVLKNNYYADLPTRKQNSFVFGSIKTKIMKHACFKLIFLEDR